MENSKKLVVYYSYTGHTKMIAESIQKKLGCDILEIKTKNTIFNRLSNSSRWRTKQW